jgi:DNA-directed RNA polymerase specialized sigma24 family protein
VRLCYTGQVKPLPGTIHGQSDPFAPTHWSVILAAGRSEAEPELARAALAQLCQTYWAPLYSFVRSRGHAVHDAQDLTQSFFAYLIEHKIYMRADREKGKFRSFLLASLKNFLGHAYDREQTLKRGGALKFLPLDDERVEAAESLFQTHSASGEPASEDLVFERTWAEAVVEAAMERLAEEQKSEGKQKLFERLRIFLSGSAGPLTAYDKLAGWSGTSSLDFAQSCYSIASSLPGIFARRGPPDRGHRRRGRRRVARVVSGTFKLKRR